MSLRSAPLDCLLFRPSETAPSGPSHGIKASLWEVINSSPVGFGGFTSGHDSFMRSCQSRPILEPDQTLSSFTHKCVFRSSKRLPGLITSALWSIQRSEQQHKVFS